MRIPGTGMDVPHPSAARDAFATVLHLLPRVVRLVGRAEVIADSIQDLVVSIAATAAGVNDASTATVDRIGSVTEGAATVVGLARDAVGEALAAIARSNAVIEQSAESVERADDVSVHAAAVVAAAADSVESARANLDLVAELINAYEPLLRGGQPAAARLAELLDRYDAERLAEAVPRLPRLIDSVEELMPTLHSLKSVAPDLRDIVEGLEELGHVVSGVPGVDRLRKRAEEQSGD